jgi:hypothetical protein
MLPVRSRSFRIRCGRESRVATCESEHGRAAESMFRGLPQAGCGPIFVSGQGVLSYAAIAVAMLLAAMNANVSAGPRVPPEPG